KCSGSVQHRTEPHSFAPGGYILAREGAKGSFGGVEDRRRCAVKFRDRRNAFGTIDQAGASQQRGKIIDLAMMIQDLVVQRREEFPETQVLLRGDLLQSVPERHFQTDRCAMAPY